MVKKLLPFLLIPGLLFASVLEMEYSFSKPVIAKGAAIVPGCRFTRDAFAPLVPVKTVRMLVPHGQAVESFDVEYESPVYLDRKNSLLPYRPGGRMSVDAPKD